MSLVIMEEERFREIVSEEIRKAIQGINTGAVEDRALSVKEAAVYLGVGKDKVYELTRRADFPAARNGNKILIPLSGLKQWLIDEAHSSNGKPTGNAAIQR